MAEELDERRARLWFKEDAPLNTYELEILDLYDTGQLQREYNQAVGEHGHGRIARGNRTMNIGGNQGGKTRQVLDNWKPPDWKKFLADPL